MIAMITLVAVLFAITTTIMFPITTTSLQSTDLGLGLGMGEARTAELWLRIDQLHLKFLQVPNGEGSFEALWSHSSREYNGWNLVSKVNQIMVLTNQVVEF